MEGIDTSLGSVQESHNSSTNALLRAKQARIALTMMDGEDGEDFLLRVLGSQLQSESMKKVVENGLEKCKFPLSVSEECSFTFSLDLPVYLDMSHESFLARISSAIRKLYPEIPPGAISRFEKSNIFSQSSDSNPCFS